MGKQLVWWCCQQVWCGPDLGMGGLTDHNNPPLQQVPACSNRLNHTNKSQLDNRRVWDCFMLIPPQDPFSLYPLLSSSPLSSHHPSVHSHDTSPLSLHPPSLPSFAYLFCLSPVRLSSQHSYPFCLISSCSPLLLSSIFPICQISSITHCFSSAFLFFPRRGPNVTVRTQHRVVSAVKRC